MRYLGHVDTHPAMDPSVIWIGVELDEAVVGNSACGGGDGKVGHKRYFSGRPGSVLFLQLSSIAGIEPRRAAAARSSPVVYVTDFL